MLRALALALLLALAGAGNAFAHASLLKAEPADGSVLGSAPTSFVLTFNEPVSPLALRLIEPDGSGLDLAGVAAKDATVSVAAPPLKPGTHALSWRVISADGHPVGGSVVFSLGAISTMEVAATSEASAGRAVAIWLARLALYLGLFVGVGGTFFAVWIAVGPLPRAAARVITTAIVVGLIAALASLGLQGIDVLDAPFVKLTTWAPWSAALATTYALTLAIVVVALLLALVSRRVSSAVALAAVGAALAASGHAADAMPQAVTRAAVFVHGISITFWVGALVPLAATSRTASLTRFSRVAPIAILLLVASGATLAVIQLGAVSALWTTSYGKILAAKLVLVAALLAIAAWNRYRLTPRLAHRALAVAIAAEMVLVVAILGLVSTWRFTPPPRTLALIAAQATPLHVHIHGDRAMADVSVTPGGVGPVSVSLAIQGGDFGPLDAKAVTLTLTNPTAGIEPIRREARHLDGVLWRIDDLILPAPGTWTAKVDIVIGSFDQVTLQQEIVVPSRP